LSKWKLDTKYIKQTEYIAMSRKKRKREKEEPGKATEFILNGVVVPPEKLARFEAKEGKGKTLTISLKDARRFDSNHFL
jgi:hypothetical protein